MSSGWQCACLGHAVADDATPRTPQTGGFTSINLDLNQMVKQGDEVAVQYNAFGDPLYRYIAPRSGIVCACQAWAGCLSMNPKLPNLHLNVLLCTVRQPLAWLGSGIRACACAIGYARL